MSAPAISVILPTWHWPSVLRYAIKTVLWQTETDFELIVVGDACQDETESVVKSFRDRRIHWINLEKNSGNQAVPNQMGLERAQGKYIAYMHQDDLWFPHHLEVLRKKMDTSDFPLAHTYCLQVSVSPDAPPGMFLRRIMGLPNSGPYGAENRIIYTPSLMHHREYALRIGGWRDWKNLDRTPVRDFLQRLLGAENRFLTVPEVTVIKFNSAERKDSYLEQPSHEQADYYQRLQTEPDLLAKELLLALDGAARGWKTISVLGAPPPDAPPGWEIAVYREMRGLSGEKPEEKKEEVSPWKTVNKWSIGNADQQESFGMGTAEKMGGDYFCWTQPIAGLRMILPPGVHKWIVDWLPLRDLAEIQFFIDGVLQTADRKEQRARIHFERKVAGTVHFAWQTAPWLRPNDQTALGLPLRLMVWQMRTPTNKKPTNE